MELKKISHLLVKIGAIAQEISVIFRRFERAARLDPNVGDLTKDPIHDHLSEIVTGAIQIRNLCRNEKDLTKQLQAQIRAGKGYNRLFSQLKGILGQCQTYAEKIKTASVGLRNELNDYRLKDLNHIRDLAKAIKVLLQLQEKEMPGTVKTIFEKKGISSDPIKLSHIETELTGFQKYWQDRYTN